MVQFPKISFFKQAWGGREVLPPAAHVQSTPVQPTLSQQQHFYQWPVPFTHTQLPSHIPASPAQELKSENQKSQETAEVLQWWKRSQKSKPRWSLRNLKAQRFPGGFNEKLSDRGKESQSYYFKKLARKKNEVIEVAEGSHIPVFVVLFLISYPIKQDSNRKRLACQIFNSSML